MCIRRCRTVGLSISRPVSVCCYQTSLQLNEMLEWMRMHVLIYHDWGVNLFNFFAKSPQYISVLTVTAAYHARCSLSREGQQICRRELPRLLL